MGIAEHISEMETAQALQGQNLRQLDTAVTKVCLAMETAMQIQTEQRVGMSTMKESVEELTKDIKDAVKIQTEHGVHLKIMSRIVYGSVTIVCLAVGGALIDVVVRSHTPTAERVERLENAPKTEVRIP